jgi:hypothetical protein
MHEEASPLTLLAPQPKPDQELFAYLITAEAELRMNWCRPPQGRTHFPLFLDPALFPPLDLDDRILFHNTRIIPVEERPLRYKGVIWWARIRCFDIYKAKGQAQPTVDILPHSLGHSGSVYRIKDEA